MLEILVPVGVCCFCAVDVVGDAVAVVVAVAVAAPAVGNIVGVASATYGWLAHHPAVEVGDAVTYDGCGDAQSHFFGLHEPKKNFNLILSSILKILILLNPFN
jgi:hypothetical protein